MMRFMGPALRKEWDLEKWGRRQKPPLHLWHYGFDTLRFQNDWGYGFPAYLAGFRFFESAATARGGL